MLLDTKRRLRVRRCALRRFDDLVCIQHKADKSLTVQPLSLRYASVRIPRVLLVHRVFRARHVPLPGTIKLAIGQDWRTRMRGRNTEARARRGRVTAGLLSQRINEDNR
jgi:hypothetical protein